MENVDKKHGVVSLNTSLINSVIDWVRTQKTITLDKIMEKFSLSHNLALSIIEKFVHDGELTASKGLDDDNVVYIVKDIPTLDNFSLLLGKDLQNDDVYVNLYKLPHLLVLGQPGSGKGFINREILQQIINHENDNPRKFEIYFYSKSGIASEYLQYGENGKLHFLSSEKILQNQLDILLLEMDKRYANDMLKNCVLFKKRHNAIVLIINNFQFHSKKRNKQSVVNKLITLIRKGRLVGIHIIISTDIFNFDYQLNNYFTSKLFLGKELNKEYYQTVFGSYYKGENVHTHFSGLLQCPSINTSDLIYLNINTSSHRIHKKSDLNIKVDREKWYTSINKFSSKTLNSSFICVDCLNEMIAFKNAKCCSCKKESNLSIKLGCIILDYIKDNYANIKPLFISDVSVEAVQKYLFYSKNDFFNFLSLKFSFSNSFKTGFRFEESERLLINDILKDKEKISKIFAHYFKEYELPKEKSKYISKIKVTNLFGFRNIEYDLHVENNISIIFGINGIGKTTIFKMINALLNGHNSEERLKNIKTIQDTIYSNFSIEFVDGSSISVLKNDENVDVQFIDSKENNYSSLFSISLSKNQNDNDLLTFAKDYYLGLDTLFPNFGDDSERFLYVDVSRLDGGKQIIERLKNLNLTGELDAFFNLNNKEALIEYLDPSKEPIFWVKKFRNIITDISLKIMACYNNLIYVCNSYQEVDSEPLYSTNKVISLLTKFRNSSFCPKSFFDMNIHEEPEGTDYHLLEDNDLYNDEYEKFEELFLELDDIYDKFILFKKKFNTFFEEHSTNKKEFIVDNGTLKIKDYSNKVLNINNLSSGELNIATILYYLIFEANNGSIVLIDEPEISLHIAWQEMFTRTVMEIIGGKDIQIIIASHSPLITSGHHEFLVKRKKGTI